MRLISWNQEILEHLQLSVRFAERVEKMSAVRRISDDPYQVEIVLSDLSKIANYEKKVPMEWINEEGNDIKDELLTYLKPLIQGEVQIPYENGIPKRFIL